MKETTDSHGVYDWAAVIDESCPYGKEPVQMVQHQNWHSHHNRIGYVSHFDVFDP